MDVDTKLIVHIFADGVAKRDDFLRTGSTEVDEHQCLFVVHSRTSQ